VCTFWPLRMSVPLLVDLIDLSALVRLPHRLHRQM